MNRLYQIASGIVCCITLAAVPQAQANICPRADGPEKIKIKIMLKETKAPDSVDQPEVRACPNDTIEWLIPGNPEQNFSIIFVEESPFDWQKTNGAKVRGTVREDAPREQPLKYDVATEAGVLDPVIIIEN